MVFLQAGSTLIEGALGQWRNSNTLTTILYTATFLLIFTSLLKKIITYFENAKNDIKYPPYISSMIPFLGQAIAFNKDPIGFLEQAYIKYGPVFSFTMAGKTFTYLIGPESSTIFFNSRNESLNAEDVYSRLVTPVFGKGVAYDVPNHIFLEQKKMFKTGLNIARFRKHVQMIEQETSDYFRKWGDSGEKDLFVALSELIILTASRCLHGKEIRSILDENIAQLYTDMDGGFTYLAWLFPGWIPFPSFIKRDRAHKKMKQIFYEAIAKRRAGDTEDDMLQTLLDSTYKTGKYLSDDEIAGMLIGLLMAGQHTSSTTSAWLGFFLAKYKDIQDQCYAEQKEVCGEDLPPVEYDQLKKMDNLDRCLKETLRLRPPIMTMMRMCRIPQTFKGYTIPPGHQVCVSPPVNQRIQDKWGEASREFKPDRFLDESAANSEKFTYIPFGAGRHRCIGENFAYVQIKTIWSVLLRKYEFELVDGFFPPVNTTTLIHTPDKPIIRYRKRK
ncbi:lanosterol 14-alpha demethylase-like [Saccoglossus kowalevskii]|uniref:Lanosterol 14-alpha demethylase n=1 Tax=Saccoglossus kowalevskii TaxID=10224 RepID=A0ABM0H0M9_SACKO|nr:PREDICTED: lanosterol 14-alpha demethylase-like [Saccoglossus kowalevskii]